MAKLTDFANADQGQMSVGEVKILSAGRPKRDGPVLLIATLRIGSVVVRDVRLVRGKNGHFIGWPTKRLETGDYEDFVYLPHPKDREAVLGILVARYESEAGEAGDRGLAR